jgi:hypothetical protein
VTSHNGPAGVSATDVTLLMCVPAVLGLIVITACWRPAYRRQIALPTSQALAGEVVKPWYVQEEAGLPEH